VSSKSTRMKNYKADELYSSLIRDLLLRMYTGIKDVVIHHVKTELDGVTHIVSLEIITESDELIFTNMTMLAGRNMYTCTKLPKKLVGKIHATW